MTLHVLNLISMGWVVFFFLQLILHFLIPSWCWSGWTSMAVSFSCFFSLSLLFFSTPPLSVLWRSCGNSGHGGAKMRCVNVHQSALGEAWGWGVNCRGEWGEREGQRWAFCMLGKINRNEMQPLFEISVSTGCLLKHVSKYVSSCFVQNS